MAPRPGAFGVLVDGDEARTVRILRGRAARPEEAPTLTCSPGTIVRGAEPDSPEMLVATGAGWLVPLEIQREGKRALPIDAFLRGHPLGEGAHFDTKRPEAADRAGSGPDPAPARSHEAGGAR
jgi:methionyl-tRNA formyltransferase